MDDAFIELRCARLLNKNFSSSSVHMRRFGLTETREIPIIELPCRRDLWESAFFYNVWRGAGVAEQGCLLSSYPG